MKACVIAALILAPLLLTACGSAIEKDKRENTLQAATYRYHSAIRWGYYDSAYSLLAPQVREQTPPPDFKGIRVATYDVVQPLTQQDPDTAVQVVEISYFHDDRQILKQLVDMQTWRWDAEQETWWLHSGLPKFQ